jgi:hypothetical protein
MTGAARQRGHFGRLCHKLPLTGARNRPRRNPGALAIQPFGGQAVSAA